MFHMHGIVDYKQLEDFLTFVLLINLNICT